MALLRLKGWPSPANPYNDSLTVFDTEAEYYCTAGIAEEYADDTMAVEAVYGRLERTLPGMLAKARAEEV